MLASVSKHNRPESKDSHGQGQIFANAAGWKND